MVEFFDPHPGFAGAAIRFPQPLLEVANSLAGSKGTIQDAIALLQQAGDTLVEQKRFRKVEVKDHSDYKFIGVSLYDGEDGYPGHSFKAISYGDKAPTETNSKPTRIGAEPMTAEEVTEAEYIKAAVAAGLSEKDAAFQATISKGLGSQTRVGDRYLKVRKTGD